MLVQLSNCLFQNGIKIGDLVVLLANSRHLVLFDLEDPFFLTWAKIEIELADRLRLLVNESARHVRSGQGLKQILVHSKLSEWNRSVPHLHLTDALQYVTLPFKIFVENSSADRKFLISFIDSYERDWIEKMEQRGWIQFVHGGGTGDLQKQIENEVNTTMRADLRTFTYFDNDGLKRNDPSKKTKQISAVCVNLAVDFHRLERRAIENYVPAHGLRLWIETHKSWRARHLFRTLTLFNTLSEDERDFFNMKGGPHSDEFSVEYPSLNKHELRQISRGFGSRLSSIFFHGDFRLKPTSQEFIRSASEVAILYNHLKAVI